MIPTALDVPRATMRFRGVEAHHAVECVDLADAPDALDRGGFWAVVGDFDGPVRAWRFAHVVRAPGRPAALPAPLSPPASRWVGPHPRSWTSSLAEVEYLAGVDRVRAAVREGDVYQVNLCRVLSAPLAAPLAADGGPDASALAAVLDAGNPAPHAGLVHVPAEDPRAFSWVVTASPELFLRAGDGRLESGPIKGTAPTAEGLTAKDRAENVMIADMVRNDLQRVCLPGTVEVTRLLAVEHHPGLVHLVTTVAGERTGAGWAEVLAATYPPASVSGAPKHAALALIRELEPVPRGPYCGTIGWVDADTGRAELAVAIRTFWWTPEGGGTVHFGTGAGVTWGSDPAAEWAETELKAARLVALASGSGTRGAREDT